jgi:hypothetical protein
MQERTTGWARQRSRSESQACDFAMGERSEDVENGQGRLEDGLFAALPDAVMLSDSTGHTDTLTRLVIANFPISLISSISVHQRKVC